jgi:hypothetical protein
MNLGAWKAAVVLAGAALCVPAAQAQTMYRCGKTYQDRPCDAGQQGRAVGSATSSQAGIPATVHADCAQRGSDAVKFVWAREAGATAERQYADIDEKRISAAEKAYERQLVADVYRRRGTAPEIRAAIQAECVAQKEQAAALAAALRAAQGQNPAAGAPAAPAGPSAEEQKAAQERRRDEQAAREAERKRTRCASLNASLESARGRSRAGGSAQAMERYRDDERRVESQIREAGC